MTPAMFTTPPNRGALVLRRADFGVALPGEPGHGRSGERGASYYGCHSRAGGGVSKRCSTQEMGAQVIPRSSVKPSADRLTRVWRQFAPPLRVVYLYLDIGGRYGSIHDPGTTVPRPEPNGASANARADSATEREFAATAARTAGCSTGYH